MFDAFLDLLHELDLALFVLCNQTGHVQILNPLMEAFSSSVVFWGTLAGLGLLFLRRKYRVRPRDLLLPLLIIGLCVGTADLSASLVKDLSKRPRPQHALPRVHYKEHGEWRTNAPDFTPVRSSNSSFFSGHAANSMTIAATIAAFFPGTSPVVFAVPLVAGYSRLYLGKHYPADVLFGWLAGWCISLLYRSLFRGVAALWRGRKKPAPPASPRPPEGESALSVK